MLLRGGGIDLAIGANDYAVGSFRNRSAHIALDDIVGDALGFAINRRAEAAAAAGEVMNLIAGFEALREDFGVRQIIDEFTVEAQINFVAETRVAAFETPWRAMGAIDLRVDSDWRARFDDPMNAETTTPATGTAGIIA